MHVDWYPSDVAISAHDDTVYAVSNGHNDVSVVNGATCNVSVVSSCSRAHARQDVGEVPSAIAVNQRTRTVYVANFTEKVRGTSVSVFGVARCNALRTSGCTHYPHLPTTVPLPFQPNDIAINARTNTIYVDGPGHRLAVINGRRCNAARSRGCRHRPFIAHVKAGAGAVTVNPSTNTVYVADYKSGIVTVIDGRSCDGTTTSGCDKAAGTVRVGRHPFRLVANAATDTVYVANFGANTVSVINGATCNGSIASGCVQRPPTVSVGDGPEGIAIDDRNHLAFVTDSLANNVSVFNTSSCSGADTSGCGQTPATIKVGHLPNGIAINPRTDTAYVADNASSRPGTLAMFRAAMP